MDFLQSHVAVLGGILFCLTFAVFAPVLRHEFVFYDDNGYVTANPHVLGGFSWANVQWAFRSTEMANWHPLTWLSHMADVEIFGQKSWGHHLTNLLLHATNALLVFVVLRKMTGAIWRSWLVAALFSLHPLHVESVAWVAERKDVLSTLWWLLTLWSYAHWTERRSANRAGAYGFYGLALFFFAAGLMSKPMVVTLPCVLLLLDFWPLRRWGAPTTVGVGPTSFRSLLVEKFPFFALSAACCVATVVAQSGVGAVSTLARLPWKIRVINALVSYWDYLEKCFNPRDLAVFYPYPETLYAQPAVFAGAFLVGVIILAATLWRSRPYLIVGWLFYLGTLVPVIGLVQVGDQAMADRYTYVPLLGIFLAVSWGVADVTRTGWEARRTLLVWAVAALLVLLGLLTNRQLAYWRTSETLSRRALAVTQNNWCAHMILGYTLAREPKRLEEAIAEYRATCRLAPSNADAHFSLAAVLVRTPTGLAEAIAEYRTALRLKPGYLQAHAALGKALMLLPDQEAAAAAEFETVVRLTPDNADAHNDLADALARMPLRLEEAIRETQAALRLRPGWVEVRNNLGILLARIPERLPDAIAEYQAVLRAKPDFAEAHYNLANALAQVPGRSAEAVAAYEAAIRIRQNYLEAHFNLGALLSEFPERRIEAMAQFEAALRIKPDLEPARAMIERLRAEPPR